MSDKQNRKLAAILFADIVGYTSLMQKDETTARKSLEKFRNTLNEKVVHHHGKVINYYGDGCLCTFDNAVDAMSCAKEVQRIFQTEPKVPVRIGLHSGEVFFEADNVYGTSVNIASRIESIAIGGGVLFSKRIKKEIEQKTAFEIQSLGEFEFKNVVESIDVYALANKGFQIPKPENIRGKLKEKRKRKWLVPLLLSVIGVLGFAYSWNTFSKPNIGITSDKSIAILPFTNLSDNQSNQFFCDGMMVDILNRLSGVKELRVISRTSVLRYRNSEKTIPTIAAELGVAHILEGSVRRVDNQIRVTVSLLQAATEQQIWSEQFDRMVTDNFGLQTEIAEKIGTGLEISLLPTEHRLLDYEPTANADAYDFFLQGRDFYHKYQENRKQEDLLSAQNLFRKAMNLDNQLAASLAYLGRISALRHTSFGEEISLIDSAFTFVNEAIQLNRQLPEAYLFRSEIYELKSQFPQMESDLKQALSLAPNSIEILRALGSFYSSEVGELEKSIPYYKKAITLEPFNVRPILSLSNVYRKVGNFPKTKNYLDQATKIEPQRVSIYMRLADINMLEGDYPTAQATAQKIIDINPDFIWGYHILAESYAFANQFEMAESPYRTIQKIVSKEGYKESFGTPPFRHRLGYVLWQTERKKEANTLLQKMVESSLKIVNSEIDNLGGARYDLAAVYAFRQQSDDAIYWLNRIFKDGAWFDIHYISIDPLFDALRTDERFIAILEREKNEVEVMREKVERMEQVDFF